MYINNLISNIYYTLVISVLPLTTDNRNMMKNKVMPQSTIGPDRVGHRGKKKYYEQIFYPIYDTTF